MPKVSIIVPVYNAEKYMEQTLNCLVNQTLKDIEIILIDDGSTDRSPQICDQYKMKDNRIKVVHKQNEGVSAARNVGIKLAQGDYIGFADADDLLELDMFEVMYTTAIKQQADLTMVGVRTHLNTGRIVDFYGTNKIYVWNDASEAIKCFLLGKNICYSCYSHLIKKELCKSVLFEEGRAMHEDRYFTFQLLEQAKKICFNDQCKYHYIIREESATNAVFNRCRFDVIYFSELITKRIKKIYPELLDYARYNELIANIQLIKCLYKDKYARKTYKREVKDITQTICGHNDFFTKEYFSNIRLIELKILIKFPQIYILILNLIKIIKRLKYRTKGKKNVGINNCSLS